MKTPHIKTDLPGPRARKILERDSQVVSPAYPRDYPFVMSRGLGAEVWDVDGNRYIDCCIAYGVLFLGHRPPAAEEAIKAQVEKGTVYGTPHPLELSYSKGLIDCIHSGQRSPSLILFCLCRSRSRCTIWGST